MKDLASAVRARGIRRLCHFTPSRNLGHILSGTRGILATKHLAADERSVLNPTDLQRHDGQTGHICCTIEYPNAWYFREVRGREVLFRDWVVLLLSPDLLLLPNVKFCPRNASAGKGVHLKEGLNGFEALFAATVDGARTYRRAVSRSSAMPTDEQAEVQIPDNIPLEAIAGVAVLNAEQARLEIERLKILRVRLPPFFIAPLFFDARGLSAAIRNGNVPPEVAVT
jgi:hypothetical protein